MNPDINFNVDQVQADLRDMHNIRSEIVHEQVPDGLHWLGIYPKWTDHAGIERWTVIAGPFGEIGSHADATTQHIANLGVFKFKRDTEDGDLLGDRSFSSTIREPEVATALADYAKQVWAYPDAEDLVDPHRPFFSGEWLVVGGPGSSGNPRWEWCVEGTPTNQWSGGCNFLADRTAVEHIIREQPTVPNDDSWFQWHGDTLVYVYDGAQWDAMDGEPSVQLIEPTEGGEYEMGFGWTWYDVDPLACDYIVPAFINDEPPTTPVRPLLPAEPYGNPNVNCLEGRRCPNCGNTDRIEVKALVWASMADDGIVDEDDHTFDDASPARCPECNFAGTWGRFRQTPTMTAGQMIAQLQKIPADTPLLGYLGGPVEDYLNVDGVHFDPGNPDIAATIELRNDYDTRQW